MQEIATDWVKENWPTAPSNFQKDLTTVAISFAHVMPTKRTANSETRKNTATTSSTASNPSVRPCVTVQDPPGPLRDAKTPLTCIDDRKKNFHQGTITAPPDETPATNALTEAEQLMLQALNQLQEIYDAPCKTKADKITIERATFAKIATTFKQTYKQIKTKTS